MNRRDQQQRSGAHDRWRGFSLLELVVAMTLLSLVMTAVSTVLRTGRQAWEVHEAEHQQVRSGLALVRHIVRHVKQAEAVESVTPSTVASGRLRIRMPDGTTLSWTHDAATGRVLFQRPDASAPFETFAENVTTLTFTPRNASFQESPAGSVDYLQWLRVDVGVTDPFDPARTRTFSGNVWLRPYGRSRSS